MNDASGASKKADTNMNDQKTSQRGSQRQLLRAIEQYLEHFIGQSIDVKNVFYVFYYFYKKRVFKLFFWNVFYFLVEKFFILLNPLKSY